MRRQYGFTKLEFALIATILAILFGTFLYAVRYQQEQAERLSVELTVMNMRTGLLSEIADRLINGKADQTADLIGANPIRFLKGPPAGYLGEYKEIDESRLTLSSWYFDLSSKELVYRINQGAGFKRSDGHQRKEIRWKIQRREVATSSYSTVDTLSLTATVPYEWY